MGDRLPSEWELADKLGAGRSAIREAMRELATLDLIEIRPGRGTFVRSLRPDLLLQEGDGLHSIASRALILEYLEMRRILEPEAAALAALRSTPTEIDRLELDVERLREGVQGGYRAPEDLGFHLDILRATHNSALARVASSLVAFYQRDLHVPTERDIEEHSRIARTIRAHDAAGAREAMQVHLLEEQHLHEGAEVP